MHDPTPPSDIVPRRGPDRATLLALNEAAFTDVEVTEPGGIVTDLDGIPAWVSPPTTTTAMLGRATVTFDDVHAAGLTPEDLPNLNIIDTKDNRS